MSIMLPAQEYFDSLQKAQLDMIEAVARTLLDATESITNANLAAACALMQADRWAAGGPSDRHRETHPPANAGDLLHSMTEAQRSYSRKLFDVACSTNAELVQIATARLSDETDRICEVLGMPFQGGPVGSEVAILFLKSAFSVPKLLLGACSKAARDAVEPVKPNIDIAAAAAPRADPASAAPSLPSHAV
jgi:hypothetical protein